MLKKRSLHGRIARLVLLLALIIGVSALALGYFLYNASITREFNTRATYVARTAASAARQHMRSVRSCNKLTVGVYESAPYEENSEDVITRFKVVQDRDYAEVRAALTNIQVKYKTLCTFIAIVDKQNNKMIYVVSSILNDPGRATGIREDITPEDIETYRFGTPTANLDKLLRNTVNPTVVYVDRGENKICRAGNILYEDSHYIYMAFADLNAEEIVQADRMFIVQFLLLLLVVSGLASILVSEIIKNTVTGPINELATAASKYSQDRSEGRYSVGYFDKLNIKTGDEIENLSISMKDMEDDLQEYILNLTEVTAEKERNNTEMDVARKIQMGMIPHAYPAFPDRPEFEIYATIDTAKMVGGDFYNFFMIDDNHVACMIADVAGKGVPAALFMMTSKMTLESISMRGDKSPGKILRKVNESLCANNAAEMFVTVWLGILEISTGILRCANAGHEYPAIRRSSGEFELYKDPHGFVLGEFEDLDYPEYELRLNPGDLIFQYTDGATDAINLNEDFFGMSRVMDALNKDKDAEPEDVIRNVSEAIDEFSQGAEQFDDLTMMVLKYAGADTRKTASVDETLEIEAVLDNLDTLNDFLADKLEAAGCDMKLITQMQLASEEIYTNVCKFAYTPDTGNVRIRFLQYQDPAEVRISFIDHGTMFDPLKHEDPDVTLAAEDRKVGGLGLYLVKQMADRVTYEYTDGQNILTIRKYI